MTDKPHSILLVEDNAIIALDMSQMLASFGCDTLGPAANVENALRLIEQSPPDAAMLDINLGTDRSWPIAYALRERSIPVILASGYAHSEIESDFAAAPLLPKPVMKSDLRHALVRVGILS